MSLFQYSYDTLVYYGEHPSVGIERVAKAGYDAIELVGEPDMFDLKETKKQLSDLGLKVGSICSIYNAERDIVHPDKKVRDNAMDYMKQIADFAGELDCPTMIAGATAVSKTAPLAPREQEHEWAIENLRTAADYAAQRNVSLCLECWNRYETYWLNRLDQGLEMVNEIDKPNVGLMGDLFHMNIDDADMAQAIRNAGSKLIHIHFADSNRAAPSKGHLDFVPVMQALKDIGYKGYITFELLPAGSDPFATLKQGGGKEFYDEYTQLAIQVIKGLEAQVK